VLTLLTGVMVGEALISRSRIRACAGIDKCQSSPSDFPLGLNLRPRFWLGLTRTLLPSPSPVTTTVTTTTHMLPPRSDIAPGHPGLQGGLKIVPSQPQQTPQQSGQEAPPFKSSRKRRKADNGEDAGPAVPHRPRRAHEACARCRIKKIKASPVGVARP
jgi:hypothetical protein